MQALQKNRRRHSALQADERTCRHLLELTRTSVIHSFLRGNGVAVASLHLCAAHAPKREQLPAPLKADWWGPLTNPTCKYIAAAR